VVVSEVINYDASSDSAIRTRQRLSRLVGPNGDASEPIVQFLYPMLTAATHGDADSAAKQNATVVGIVASTFSWRSFLTDILPEGENGLVFVFANECNQSFTYQVNGHEAVYLGPGDRHDAKYDGMRLSMTLNRLIEFNSGSSAYSGLALVDDFCAYTVSAFPSEEMESSYRSSDPIVFTIAAVAIFAFTAVVFFAYDKLVTVRQHKVLTTAQKSNAIVSSLFPSNVRDRLLDDSNVVGGGAFQPNKAKLKTFMNGGAFSIEESESRIAESKPIADLFTDCTVLFADIANFTAWSSVREPGQVFTLLETVYGAFDMIAARRGVFKVEVRTATYRHGLADVQPSQSPLSHPHATRFMICKTNSNHFPQSRR
jgi:hypothetical protein